MHPPPLCIAPPQGKKGGEVDRRLKKLCLAHWRLSLGRRHRRQLQAQLEREEKRRQEAEAERDEMAKRLKEVQFELKQSRRELKVGLGTPTQDTPSPPRAM